MHDMSLLYIVFRIINFGIFCALALMIYRRYAKPMLLEQMLQREQQEHELSSQVAQANDLIAQKKEELAQAQLEGKYLIERMKQWSQTQQARVEEINALSAQRASQAEERLLIMGERAYQEQLSHDILTPALEKVEVELRQQFTRQDEQQQFAKKAIKAFMQEGS